MMKIPLKWTLLLLAAITLTGCCEDEYIKIKTSPGLGTTHEGCPYAKRLKAVITDGCGYESEHGIEWSVIEGPLPLGLTLASSGKLSGVPETVGTWTFQLRASGLVEKSDEDFEGETETWYEWDWDTQWFTLIVEPRP